MEDVLAKVREELGDAAAELLGRSLAGEPEPEPVEPTNDAPGSIN